MSLDCQVAVMKVPYSQKEKREKQGCHASRWEQRLFTSCLPGTGEKDIHFSVGFVPFSLVYAPPADLIMSMPPETRCNKFSPLQWHVWWKKHRADPGSGCRFLELAVAPVPPWTLQIRVCYPKRRKWHSGRVQGWAPHLWEKRQAWGDPNKVFLQCFLYSSFSPSFPWGRLFTLYQCLEAKCEVPYNTKITVLQGTGCLFTKTSYGPSWMHFVKC